MKRAQRGAINKERVLFKNIYFIIRSLLKSFGRGLDKLVVFYFTKVNANY